MIVFESKKLVILTPPHTASRSLHTTCCAMGAMYVVGPQPDGTVDQHTTAIAAEWAGFRVAVVVRHPFDRLIGLYHHHSDWMTSQGWIPLPWWLFVAQVLENNSMLSWMYKATIATWLGPVQPDEIVRYEQLWESLEVLLDEPIRLAGQSTSRDLSAYTAQESVLLMTEYWGRADMNRWHYASRRAT